jgi:hypothetical protein
MTTPQEDEDVLVPDMSPDDAQEDGSLLYDNSDEVTDTGGKPGAGDYAAYGGGYPDDAGQAGPGDADEGTDAAEDDGADVDEQAEPGETYQGETWQGEDGRTYCRRSDGTTGLIVGGGAGALIGNGIDGGRRRGTGTIIGGIIGAVVGTAIERSANEQSCR